MPLNNILEVEFLMYWVLIVWVILFVLSISSTFCLEWIMYLNGFKLLLFLPRMLRLCFKFLEKKFFFIRFRTLRAIISDKGFNSVISNLKHF